jgi:glycosyltransferase involved in cell wall biosynthesis
MWWGWMRAIIVPRAFIRGIVEGPGIPAQKLHLTHTAYPGPSAFEPARAACRARLGLPPERVVLLSVCRLMVWKGVDGLIRALARMPEAHHLYVAGDGDELENWTGLAARLGLADRVHFLGNVPHAELMGWIRAADLFLLNSSYEGLSHTLLEVMWLGAPAAVSAVGGNVELIQDRVNGRTFPHQDEQAILAAAQEILSDPAVRDRYVARGRERAAAFAREGIFERTERLFLEATGQSSPEEHAAHLPRGPAHATT